MRFGQFCSKENLKNENDFLQFVWLYCDQKTHFLGPFIVLFVYMLSKEKKNSKTIKVSTCSNKKKTEQFAYESVEVPETRIKKTMFQPVSFCFTS